MVDATLHVNAVQPPVIQASSNMPLRMEVTDRVRIEVELEQPVLRAKRATTSDPWSVEALVNKVNCRMIFSGGTYVIDTDDLNWKSMADLGIKQHLKALNNSKWEYLNGFRTPFVIADATSPTGFRGATDAEIKAGVYVIPDEGGNFRVHYDGNGAGLVVAGTTGSGATLASQLNAMLTAMMAATSATSFAADGNFCLADTREPATGALYTNYVMKDNQGTNAITLGNYTSGKLRLAMYAQPAGGYDTLHSVKVLDKDEAFSIPSTHLDHFRRAAKAGLNPYLSVEIVPGDGIFCDSNWAAANNGAAGDIIFVSTLSPASMFEIDFDQENSLNVLAAAAFAGLAGLASVGVATELQNLLANSALAPVFQNVAVALGATASGVITGYVSALIAAYTNGWISNEQLFNLTQHAEWLSAGYKVIAMSATAGAAVTGISGVLSYLGVANNVIATAITMAGGATAGAGVALGMASVMANVIRHRYLGE